MSLIEVQNLTTKFGKNIIHNDISFNVDESEIFAIMGNSGSGKSTLLRVMLMLTPPSSGTIKLFDTDIYALKMIDRINILNKIGVMFQFGALFSSLSIEQNITSALDFYTNYPAQTKIELAKMWIDMVGLKQEVLQMQPYELSGGMKKRVALARALALNPKILFLDEPTSGLDPLSSSNFDELILKLREDIGVTIVMVSHDVDSICSSADRILMLKNAKIEYLGKKKDFAKYIDENNLRKELFGLKRGDGFWNVK